MAKLTKRIVDAAGVRGKEYLIWDDELPGFGLRVFESYDQIVSLCCDAWRRLRDQPWRVMSIGRRSWAHA